MKKTFAALAVLAAMPFAAGAQAQTTETRPVQTQPSGEMSMPAAGEGVDTMTTNSIENGMPRIVAPEMDDDGGILVPGSGATFMEPTEKPSQAQEEAITNDQSNERDEVQR